MHMRRKKSQADKVVEAVGDFADKAADLTKEAAATLAPKLEIARDTAVKGIDQASARVRDEVVPKVRDEYTSRRDEYVPRAKQAAAPAIAAALAKAPGIEPPAKKKKKSRLKKLLVLLGLGGVAAFVAMKLLGDSGSGSTPTAAPRPTPRPTPVPDPAPEEAAADPVAGPAATANPEADPSDPLTEDLPAAPKVEEEGKRKKES